MAQSTAGIKLKEDLDEAVKNVGNQYLFQKNKKVTIYFSGLGIGAGVLYAMIKRKKIIGIITHGIMGMAAGTGMACIISAFLPLKTQNHEKNK